MREIVATFGRGNILTGIVTKPVETESAQNRPCVILLNAGLLHHVGPFRLSVELARALVKSGFTVLRFDLSGIGDSGNHQDSRDTQERTMGDISDAITFMQSRYGCDQAVLIGLCTGADNAHKAAVADQRVCGAVFLDGYAYPTAGFYLRRYVIKALNPAAWGRLIKRSCLKIIAPSVKDDALSASPDASYFWQLPPKAKVISELQHLTSRGVHQLHIYTGTSQIYRYERQFSRMYSRLDFKECIESIYFADADHTFILSIDRIKLIATLDGWLTKHFSSFVSG